MSNNNTDVKKGTFAELERVEDKYIIKLDDLEDIKAEVEKHMKPAYLNKNTDYVLINSTYLDTPDRKSFRLHIGGADHRQKIRYRKYGPNGHWEENSVFLEVKEKEGEDVHKARLQLDKDNLEQVRLGKEMELTESLSELNSPLYTFSTLNKFVNKYNKLVVDSKLKPVISITYKRLAYGKGSLRVTFDGTITSHPVGVLSLSEATKIKQSVDWNKVKDYKDKYSNSDNMILEVKHNSVIPVWLKNLLDKYDLKSESFSKYIWCTYSAVKML